MFVSPCPAGMSVDQLSKLRARELKAALTAAGVSTEDCFEKEQLISKIRWACGAAS